MIYHGALRSWSLEENAGGAKTPSSVPGERRRAVILEPHPAVRAVLEHVMVREGYLVEAGENPGDYPTVEPGAALLLASLPTHDGLYVLETRDLARTLESLARVGELELPAVATGMHAYLPRPFGVEDVLRAVRAVSGFDSRRRFTESPR